jgi:hypothetical protein
VPQKKPEIKIESCRRYSKWKRGSKKLPSILEFTNTIKTYEGNEFGMILRIKKGKGLKLIYFIKHPSFLNDDGIIALDFIGKYFVNSNDFQFYIGDSIWLLVEDKIGTWEVIVYHEDIIIASKSFKIVLPK